MSRISKKVIKGIRIASVYDSVLRDKFESSLFGYFADHNPDTWNDEQKEIFGIASEVEHRFREEVLKILGVAAETENQ